MKKKLWNKDYVLMLQGSAVSSIGDMMYSVAIGFWVYQQTGSSALMGIMSSISMFVTMFLSPFAGSIVDKCNRKWLIVLVDTLQGCLMLTIGILAHFDRLEVPGVLIVAFLAAFGSVFYSPAVNTLMIDIIPKDDMVRGQSIHSGVLGLIQLSGNALSGVMVAFFGVPLIVVLNGLSNLYSAVTELFVTVPRTVQQGNPVTVKGVLRDSVTAVKTIFSNRFLRLFAPCAFGINLLASGPLSLMLPFCMEKGYTVEMYGYLMSIQTAASFVCVFLLGVIKFKPKARYWIQAAGFVCSIPCMLVAFLVHNYLVMCVFAFVGTFLNMAGNTVFNASMMLALPEENRGAILGFISSASIGGVALSTLVYGFLGEMVPLHLLFVAGGCLSLPLMLYLCLDRRTKEFVLSH